MRWVAHFRGKETEVRTSQKAEAGYQVQLGEDTPIEIRLVHRQGDRLILQSGDKVIDVVVYRKGEALSVLWAGQKYDVELESYRDHLLRESGGFEQAGPAVLKAQMPGKIVRLLKQEGDSVELGDGLVVIESMKMQNELKSPKSGQVVKVGIVQGQTVSAGDLLYQVE